MEKDLLSEHAKALAAEVSFHFATSSNRPFNSQLDNLAQLSAPFALEAYLPSKHSSNQGLHYRITNLISDASILARDHNGTTPSLISDVLARLCAAIKHMPPGLVKDQRAADKIAHKASTCLKLVQAILRAETRITASQANGSKSAAGSACDDSNVIRNKVAELTLQTGRVHLSKIKAIRASREWFDELDEHLEWLQDFGFSTTVPELLDMLGEHARCGEYRMSIGQLVQASQSFVQAKDYVRARDCLMKELLRTAPLGTTFEGAEAVLSAKVKVQVKHLLDKLTAIPNADTAPSILVQAYSCMVISGLSLRQLASEVLEGHSNAKADQLLILDLLLQRRLKVYDLPDNSRKAYIGIAERYCKLLQPLCSKEAWPTGVFELLGLRHPLLVDAGDGVNRPDTSLAVIPPASPLFKLLRSKGEAYEGGCAVEIPILHDDVSQFFTERLFNLLQDIYRNVNEAPWTNPPCMVTAHNETFLNESQHTREHVKQNFYPYLRRRTLFWCGMLPLSRQVRWLSNLLQKDAHKLETCQRYGEVVLDALVLLLSPSSRVLGSLRDLLERLSPQEDLHISFIFQEAIEALAILKDSVKGDRFLDQLLGYSALAAFASPLRVAPELEHTNVINRKPPAPVRSSSPHSTFGFIIRNFLRDIHGVATVRAEAMTEGLDLVESVLRSSQPIRLNNVLHILDTLTIMATVGGLQVGGARHGFDNLLLPETLVRQAVLQFHNTRIHISWSITERLLDVLKDLIVLLLRRGKRASYKPSTSSTIAHGVLFLLDAEYPSPTAFHLIAARLLQQLVLIGFHDPYGALAHPLARKVLILLEMARMEVPDVDSNETMANYQPSEIVASYYNAKNWGDLHQALQSQDYGQRSLDRLVRLTFGPLEECGPISGIGRIDAANPNELHSLWTGTIKQIEVKPQPKGPVTLQTLSDLSEVIRSSCEKFTMSASGPPPDEWFNFIDGKASKGVAASDVGKNGEPNLATDHDLNVVDADLSVSEQDLKKIAAATTIQQAWKAFIEARKTRAAKAIQRVWRRKAASQAFKAAIASSSFLKCQVETIALAKPLKKTDKLYRSTMVECYPHYNEVILGLARELNSVRDKPSKKANDGTENDETFIGKMLAIKACRTKLSALRQTLPQVMTTGKLDLLRRTLDPLAALSRELHSIAGTEARQTCWKTIFYHLKEGQKAFEHDNKAATRKKKKRPALNIDDLTTSRALSIYYKDC